MNACDEFMAPPTRWFVLPPERAAVWGRLRCYLDCGIFIPRHVVNVQRETRREKYRYRVLGLR